MLYKVSIHKCLLQAVKNYIKTGGNEAVITRRNIYQATTRFDITPENLIRYLITGYGDESCREGEILAIKLSPDNCLPNSFVTLEIESEHEIFDYYKNDFNTPLIYALVWLGIAIPRHYDGFRLIEQKYNDRNS